MQPIPDDVVKGFTREAVRDVFKRMLELEVQDAEPVPLPPDPAGQIITSLGFIGETTGIIHIYAGAGFGRHVTCKMLGLTEAEVDDEMINDAFAELGNMVVGAVKSKLCDRGWPCVLTIPSIMRGNELHIETITDVKRSVLGISAGAQRLHVQIDIKNP